MKILFIINPVAGNGKGEEAWQNMTKYLKETFNDYDVVSTTCPGDAKEIARKAVDDGYEAIISCGGDGTLNEVINGVIGTEVKVGLIPTGTGSDFGKTVGIRNLEDALTVIKNGKSTKLDVAKVEYGSPRQTRFFINILEIGFGAEVMKYVNSHKRSGKYSFVLGILSVIWKLKKFKAKLDLNGFSEIKTIEVIVANGKYFGGGMLASPESSVDDGYLDIHILKPVSKFTTLLRLRDLIKGTYIKKGFSLDIKARSFNFVEGGNLTEMDGEVIGNTPISVSILGKAVDFLIP